MIVVLTAWAAAGHIAPAVAATRRRLEFSPSSEQEPCDSATCQARQREALKSVFEAWGGPSWRNSSGWLSVSYHCAWYGVICCSVNAAPGGSNDLGQAVEDLEDVPCTGGGVIGLSLAYNNVSGTLADGVAAMSALATLQLLDLDTNHMRGTVPESLSVLSRLLHLNLGSNDQLTGPLRVEAFSTMTALSALLIPDSRLSGSVPALSSYLQAIRHLDLGDNDVGGSTVDLVSASVSFVVLRVHARVHTASPCGMRPSATSVARAHQASHACRWMQAGRHGCSSSRLWYGTSVCGGGGGGGGAHLLLCATLCRRMPSLPALRPGS